MSDQFMNEFSNRCRIVASNLDILNNCRMRQNTGLFG